MSKFGGIMPVNNLMPSINDLESVISKYSIKIDHRINTIEDFLKSDNVELQTVIQTLEKELYEDKIVLAALKHYYYNTV